MYELELTSMSVKKLTMYINMYIILKFELYTRIK